MVYFAERTQNCGVIGFAGGLVAKRNFLSWGWGMLKGRYRYYDSDHNIKTYDISDLGSE
jgi:hypothetical protein